jgi:hypothetical protein
MAETNNLKALFDRIPVYGETGLAGVARAHDSENLKNKNAHLRRYGRNSGFDDWRASFLAPNRPARKSLGDRV